MLRDLTKIKTEEGETANINVIHKNNELTNETCSSKTTSDEEIDKLEEAFGKLQRITNKYIYIYIYT